MRKTGRIVLLVVSLALTAAVPARAELVFFADGRTMSVKAYSLEGGSMVLSLRAGGQIICDPSLIARIDADEIPYPEPEQTRPKDEIGLKPDLGGNGQATTGAFGGIRLQPDSSLVADTRYDPLIQQSAAKHGVDATLVRAVIQVESNYEPRARSRKGAKGLMQLMPATARQYGVSNPYDPATNIEAGIRHLKSLLDRFPLELALAAYNAGESAVEHFRGVPPFSETRSYVDRILKLLGRS